MGFNISRLFPALGHGRDDCCSLAGVLERAMDRYNFGEVFFDSTGRIIRSNRRAREFIPEIGMGGEGQRALNLQEFIDYLFDHSVECNESLKNALSQTLDSGDEVTFREVISVKNGDLCLVEAKNIGDEHTLFIITDISRQKAREDHLLYLNKNNYRLHKAIQSATNGIIISDPKLPDNPYIFVNTAFCNFFDLTPGRVIGQSWESLPHLVRNPSIKNSLIQSVVLKREADIELSIEQGKIQRWFTMKMSVVHDGRGHPDLYVGVFTEITELKKRESEAFQSQKLEALGKLAGGVAHDFNNILSIIDGFSIMAAKTVAPDSEVGQYLQKIQAAAKRGGALTGKMLTFSRHKVVSRNVFDLSAFVEGQKILLQPLVDASIRFDVKIKDSDVRVSASEDSVAQILMNLVVNARDAMPGGGMLTVDVEACKRDDLPERVLGLIEGVRFARLTVSDTGVGMDASTMARIFDPFFTTKPQGKGTGLGLSIVYGLVSEMGGAIHIESQPGEGTSISLYLPLSESEVTRKISGDVRDPSTLKLKGVTILVAEDEPELRMIVCDMLERMEATVLRASNGNEALLVQEEYDGDIDILLSDVVMPEMNGVKLASLLCSLRPEVQIVFMSGYPNSGEMAPVEVPDGAIFIPKPVDYERLALVLYQMVFKDSVNSSVSGGVVEPHWVSS